jgi:hypothetical protein
MSSLFLILLCCLGSLIIHLWFYSDFFAYYLKSFQPLLPQNFYKWFLIDEFLNNQDPELSFDSYIEYLYIQRCFSESFLIKFLLKLFSCVLCFTTWVALILSIIFGNIIYIGLIFLILRILDFILRYVLKKSV